MTRKGRVLVPATGPFWLKPASTFGLLSMTMFIARSPGFAIPSILAPLRLDADRDIVPSRFRRQSADCGSIVRRRCTRRYLLAHLRRIPLMGQRVVSWHHATHNNDSDDFMSQPPVRPARETFASYGSRERDLPIRRTKSPKAEFLGAELWIDGSLSPWRAVAMLSPTELQRGGGEFQESAPGATGQGDPWAKRLGDDHRARRRCGPTHRADGQDGLCGGARPASPAALEATAAQLGLDGGDLAGVYPHGRGPPEGDRSRRHQRHAPHPEPPERPKYRAARFQ